MDNLVLKISWTAFLLFISVRGLYRSDEFLLLLPTRRPDVGTVCHDVHDATGCAVACAAVENFVCTGFQILDDRCVLLTGIIEPQVDPISARIDKDLVYYKRNPSKCTSYPGFQIVTTAARSFCFKYFPIRMRLEDAREKCRSENSFLVFSDDFEKSTAITKLTPPSELRALIINAKFDHSTDAFKGERRGDVLTLDNPFWAFGEPGAWSTYTQCVVIKPTALFNDVSCTAEMFHFVCEVPGVEF